MSGPEPVGLAKLATAAAVRAGEYLRSVSRPADPATWSSKGTSDWVTVVDRTSEEIVSEILLKGEPGSTIVGEELSPEITTRGLVWVVDPLDGTTNFLHGFPVFAVSIGAAVDGEVQAGVVLHVPLNRLSHATKGAGAWEGDQRLEVSPITDPRHTLIGTGFPFSHFEGMAAYQAEFTRVALATSGIRRAGAAAIDLADVAAGRYEGFWEQRLSAWDIAAGMLLVREAGGIVTNYAGRDLGIEHSSIVAGNPMIHQWLRAVLSAEC